MEQELLRRIRELEDHSACLEEIIRNISEGVILTDEACKIVLFNPAKERMEQMRADHVVGKISWEAYEHSNREISEHQQVSDTREPIVNAYRPHAYVGDAPVYIYYSTYPVVRDGRLLGVYTISRNETLLRELLYETIEHKRRLSAENVPQPEPARMAKGTQFTFADFVGDSPLIREVLREAQTVAALEASLLITGETGTGKEVLAQSIHNFGRETKNFIAINCAAIPEALLESTLFGSVKGAFTGAADSHGLFREAANGTLFLDEINSMSTAMQAKLLRALQEKCVRPVGGLQEYPIRCRLICASNEEPATLLREGRMRLDLFYRISDFVLSLPPLRERREDILALAELFIARYNREFGRNIKRVSPRLRERLMRHDWLGNTRELRHVIQNMMLRTAETAAELEDAGFSLYGCPPAVSAPPPAAAYLETDDLNAALAALQREIIENRLRACKGNITQAAHGLGLQRQNLAERMRRLEITPPK